MRQRRGNYSILFVLTVTVMLGYMAFAIDGGRQKIAVIQSENAAEAATLAALAVVRDGGTKSQAEDAARNAANQVRLQRVRANRSADQDFDVRIRWGRWDWDEAMTEAGGRWTTQSSRVQSTTVNVRMAGDGIANIFGPAIRMLADIEKGESSDLISPDRPGAGSSNFRSYDEFKVSYGSRAAMRNRDIVFVVDISRESEPVIDGIQDGLTAMIDTMDALFVPGDRVALVGYAGRPFTFDLTDTAALTTGIMGEPGFALYSLADNYTSISTIMAGLEPCRYTMSQWYFADRFTDPAFNGEVNGGYVGLNATWDYRALRPMTGDWQNGPWTLAWDLSEDAGFITYVGLLYDLNYAVLNGRPPLATVAATGVEMTAEDQCELWADIRLAFTQEDLRLERQRNTGILSPLACDEGSIWEGDPERYVNDTELAAMPSVSCPGADAGGATLENKDGTFTPSFETPVVGQPWAPLDQAFFQAGSDPGAALLRAEDILDDRPTRGEPTVVWITRGNTNWISCGPNVDAAKPTCAGDRQNQVAVALNALDAIDAIVHVVTVEPDPLIAPTLAGYTQGRGQYLEVESAEDLDDLIDILARDIRLQVVQ